VRVKLMNWKRSADAGYQPRAPWHRDSPGDGCPTHRTIICLSQSAGGSCPNVTEVLERGERAITSVSSGSEVLLLPFHL
jgi:hypothetical protein